MSDIKCYLFDVPCPWLNSKAFVRRFDKVKKEFTNVDFKYFDAYLEKDTCKSYNVEFVPTLLIIKDDKEVYRFNGMMLIKALRSILRKFSK